MYICKRLALLNGRDFSQNIFFSVFKSQTTIRQKTSLSPSQRIDADNSESDTTLTGEKKKTRPRLRAIDLAQKVQQEKAKTEEAEKPLPSSRLLKRVMELKRFSRQLQNVHPNVLAKHLHQSVMYRNKDMVFVNKPYGVPVLESSEVTSITSVIPVLAKLMSGRKMKSDLQLHPCMGPEKDTSGTLLLATSEEAAERILKLNRENEVEHKYWAITVGIPVPSEGTIDIPIVEKKIKGPQTHFKMALSPCFKMNDTGDGLNKTRVSRQAHAAVTKYRVLDGNNGCSLIELQPLTRVKNQLRVHMAYAVACPIIGDHKYAHWTKLAPQKLPERVLKRLGLQQSKSRYLPVHLHNRQLTLQGFYEDKTIKVSCPLPKYFINTLNRLQLTFPDDE